MAVSPAQHAIARLIELAEHGEIDPWNVQVIDVIDRFLSELAPFQHGMSREADLSESGQVFLYASMLVLLKADSLVRMEISPSAPEAGEDLEALESVPPTLSPLPPLLERHLRRRGSTQPLRQRQVTLSELIAQLQQMAAVLEQSPPSRLRPRRLRRPSQSQTAQAIAQLAHQENLSEVALQLEQVLAMYMPSNTEEDWVDLEQLLEWLPQKDRVGAFWGLLLLSAQSKVLLDQSEFYQDLRVRRLFEVSVSVPQQLSIAQIG
jgi:segregation and condensation protein A